MINKRIQQPMNKIQQIENDIQDLMMEAHEIIWKDRPDISGVGFTTSNGGYFTAWSEGTENAVGESFKQCLDCLPAPIASRAKRIEKLKSELAKLEGECK
jgi:prefoldin subunit 5